MMAQPTEQKGQTLGVGLALSRRNSLGFIGTPVWLDMHCEKSYFMFFETLRRMILSLLMEGFRQILIQATESRNR
jgi:hypothetical protein